MSQLSFTEMNISCAFKDFFVRFWIYIMNYFLYLLQKCVISRIHLSVNAESVLIVLLCIAVNLQILMLPRVCAN